MFDTNGNIVPVSTNSMVSTLIKRKTVSLSLTSFGGASSGGYYKLFDFSGITSNNVIAVNVKSYSGS